MRAGWVDLDEFPAIIVAKWDEEDDRWLSKYVPVPFWVFRSDSDFEAM